MTLQVGLPESSGGRIRSFLMPIHHGFPFSYIMWGMNTRPVGDHSSETQSHPINMTIIIIILIEK
jgi:hypothetical protein